MQTRGITTRQILKTAGLAGATLAVPWEVLVQGSASAFAFFQSPGLQKFVQQLRGVGPGGIPVAAADAFAAPVTGVTHYSIGIGQFTDQLHPSLGPTTLWGYNPAVALGGGTQPQKHLGSIIVAQRGTPIQITFTNRLPARHILPVDVSANFPDAALRQNMAVTHFTAGSCPGSATAAHSPGPHRTVNTGQAS